jgi:hypothetical protein
MNNQGTPKTLDEAIVRILTTGGGLMKPDHASWLKDVLRDYLAQKFAAAMLQCKTANEETALKHLWERITGETKG